MSRYDFSGWVTRNDITCTDGRTIRKNAFQHNDGSVVPLVWNHQHNDPTNILGKVHLQNKEEGVYGYAELNDTEAASTARELIRHGDIDSFSIYASQIKQSGGDVLHGDIKEVSLVLAGANRGAKIENLYFEHADGSTSVYDGEAIIYPGEPFIFETGELSHADEKNEEDKEMPTNKDKTVQDVIDEMTEEQKQVLYFLVGQAAEGGSNTSKESDSVKHNAFDGCEDTDVIQHGEELRQDILMGIASDNRSRNNITSLKDFIEHAAGEYGIDDIDYLFPDARTLTNTPEFIKREDDWVDTFMNASKHTPFTRVKTMFADITADEARAKGYTKGNKKVEEVITLLKRTTEPTTIYKKQKLDRDDILDITDFDVVVWLKTEMRMMLNEEIARAALVGDGRSSASNDKVDETKIRPIWTDDSLFTIPVKVSVSANATDDQKSEAVIRSVLKARKNYKGTGNPTFFTTEDVLTDMLLIEDGVGRRKYDTIEDVARALRVSKIVTVPVMENLSRTVTLDGGGTETRNLVGIVVNPIDYNFGSDKGGAVSMFDDFDIDYNQQKYLMETRCSGALVKPYSAMAVEMVTSANG